MTAQAGDILLLKQTLRRQARARRLHIPVPIRKRAAVQAARHALRALRARRVRVVTAYLETGAELPTGPLLSMLARAGIQLGLPCSGRDGQMQFQRWQPGQPLLAKRYGIREPARRRSQLRYGQIDLMLLPLLGFDAHGTRLGAGGGYYDRYLSRPHRQRQPLRVGYAYALQEFETLPRESWDARLDAVITERGWRWLTG